MNSSNVFFRRCSRWSGGVEGLCVCTVIFAKFALPADFEIGATAICGILKKTSNYAQAWIHDTYLLADRTRNRSAVFAGRPAGSEEGANS